MVIATTIRRSLRRYGSYVGQHPRPFLIGPILMTGFFSLFISTGREERNIKRLYVPLDAPSRVELQVAEAYQHESSLDDLHWFELLLHRKNFGNLLTPSTMEEIVDVCNHFEENITVTSYSNPSISYNFIELKHAFSTHSVYDGCRFLRLFTKLAFDDRYRSSPQVQLTSPIMTAFGKRIFVPLFLHGVETDANTSVITGVQVVHLRWDLSQARNVPHSMQLNLTDVMTQFGAKLRLYSDAFNDRDRGDDELQLLVFYPEALTEAIGENTAQTLPKFALSFLLLIAFTFGSNLDFTNPARSKPILAMLGVVSPLLAIATTFGLLFLLGYPMSDVVATMPFLILSIGVDDAFILIAAWQSTDAEDAVDERLAGALEEAAVSITFTSLTDAVAFGVGTFANTPAVSMFCVFTSTAVLIDYLYQLTFFVSLMAYSGHRESRMAPKGEELEKKLTTGSLARKTIALLNKNFVKFVLVMTLAAHIFVSLLCCTRQQVGLSPAKLVFESNPLRRFLDVMETRVWPEGSYVAVLVDAPPDIENRSEIDSFFKTVNRFETESMFAVGADATVLWLRDYLKTLDHMSGVVEPDRFLPEWLRVLDYSFFAVLGNHSVDRNRSLEPIVKKMLFYVGYRNVKTWFARHEALAHWRSIAAENSRWNLTVFHQDNLFTDEVVSLASSTMQTTGMSILSMVFISIAFLPKNFSAQFWIIYSMLSSTAGVVGYVELWGAELDPITMLTTTMSIGFSVDLVSHVAYKYHSSEGRNPEENVVMTLESIGWPVFQAATSTICGVLILAFVPSYMTQVFFATVFLVTVLGVFHGLCILPVVLSTLDENANVCEQNRALTCKNGYYLIPMDDDDDGID